MLSKLRKQLKVNMGRSITLAATLADFAPRSTAVVEVEGLYGELRKHRESEEDLFPLKVKIDLLKKREYDSALATAERWVQHSPLNAVAVQQLISVRGHMFADLSGAIDRWECGDSPTARK